MTMISGKMSVISGQYVILFQCLCLDNLATIIFDIRPNVCDILYRGYLLFWGEYQIYYIECGEKNKYFSRVCSTSENADIFTARDEIYLVFASKK